MFLVWVLGINENNSLQRWVPSQRAGKIESQKKDWLALDPGRCADARCQLCPVLPPLAHFSECGVLLSSRGGRSASPLIEESLKRPSSEFLSCLTYVLFKGGPEGPETMESLGPRGFLIIRVNPPRLYPSTTEQTWHKSHITTINTEASSQGTARHDPEPFLILI